MRRLLLHRCTPATFRPLAQRSLIPSLNSRRPFSTQGPPPPSPSSPRPFRVLGLQQVAIGGLSKSALLSLWSDLLGLPVHSAFTSATENVDEAVLHLGPPPPSPYTVELDLMQPLDPARSPKPHIPALNHVGLWVDDLRGAVEWLGGKGVRFTPGGVRKGASGFDVCFIHPKGDEAKGTRGGEGVLIELVQAPAAVIEAFTQLADRR